MAFHYRKNIKGILLCVHRTSIYRTLTMYTSTVYKAQGLQLGIKRPHLSIHKFLVKWHYRIFPLFFCLFVFRKNKTNICAHSLSTAASTVNCYSEYQMLRNVSAQTTSHSLPAPKPKPQRKLKRNHRQHLQASGIHLRNL